MSIKDILHWIGILLLIAIIVLALVLWIIFWLDSCALKPIAEAPVICIGSR